MLVQNILWENEDERIIGVSVKIDGEIEFDVFEDEPEDMTFLRTLKDCLKVSDLLKLAYEAGKNGKSFDFYEVTRFAC
jgi:hypothetical protein